MEDIKVYITDYGQYCMLNIINAYLLCHIIRKHTSLYQMTENNSIYKWYQVYYGTWAQWRSYCSLHICWILSGEENNWQERVHSISQGESAFLSLNIFRLLWHIYNFWQISTKKYWYQKKRFTWKYTSSSGVTSANKLYFSHKFSWSDFFFLHG